MGINTLCFLEMEDKLKYFEEIACYLTGTNYEDLFGKTKKEEAKTARQWCMYYMVKVLGHTTMLSGNRYNRDHATCIHAIKTVVNDCETNKNYRVDFEEFLAFCEVRRATEEKRFDFRKFIGKENESGYRGDVWASIRILSDLIYKLHKFMDDTYDEDEIMENIMSASGAISNLHNLFKKDDSKRVVDKK